MAKKNSIGKEGRASERQKEIRWKMERFSARAFFVAGYLLDTIQTDCLMSSTIVGPDEPMYRLDGQLDARIKEKATKYLKLIEDACISIGLNISVGLAKDAADAIAHHGELLNYQWLNDQTSSLKRTIQREMKNHAFFYITPDKMDLWPKADDCPFGESVGNSFGSALWDIRNSASCLAIGLGTASVFHAMRVLEIGLSALGALFGVSLAHTNWDPAIREIESKIREMHKDPIWKASPNCKELQEEYAQAASHFGVLKDAWRNYTMHSRSKYANEDAEQIFQNVKGFMQKLAKLGLKEVP
jgi:hypothetical protein